MSKGKIWFGTERDMRWIPAPLPNYTRTNVRWRMEDLYLNGGANMRQSDTGHEVIDLAWPVQSAESLAPVVNLLHQPGPFHLLDPIAMKTNVLPPYQAMPMLAIYDAPHLVPTIETKRYQTTSSGNGYPYMSASITTTKANTPTNINIPVPPGYTLHMGVHGTGGTYRINDGPTANMLNKTTNQRTNMTFVGPGFANLVIATAAQCIIAGIIAQILPTGKSPLAGGFLPGQGTSALVLKDDYSLTNYSSELPNAQQGLAATFVEVGAWLP